MMPDEEDVALREELEKFRLEHRALDEETQRLAQDPMVDQLQLRRLKKRKLALKDAIARIESALIPDRLA